MLPSSHILTECLSKVGDNAIAGGAFGDVWYVVIVLTSSPELAELMRL